MIARVKIAPVEQWCESSAPLSHRIHLLPLVGQYVRIFTNTTKKDKVEPAGNNLCGGIWWDMHEDDRKIFSELIGHECGDCICEHMLEMD